MPTSTTNFGLQKPLVNDATDQDLWGGQLNTDMDDIDALMLTALTWTPTAETSSFSVIAPTAASINTGSSKLLYLCNATSGAIVPSLPAASTANGMTVAFKKTDASANTVTISGHSAETIDGSNTLVLSARYDWVILVCDGTGWQVLSKVSSALVAPTSQVLTSGTGATYTTPANCKRLEIRMIGGGGGGGASGGSPTAGSNGTASSFNSIAAAFGAGGATSTNSLGGAGGSGGSGSATVRMPGQNGGSVFVTGAQTDPGDGGQGALGGGGRAGLYQNSNGGAGRTNSGSGGGGATTSTAINTGAGGGAGEYVEFSINSPAATYTYTVGAGGAGGTGTQAGGAGAAGIIIVKEYYY